MNECLRSTASTLNGGAIVARSWTPIDARFLPLPRAKCNFSWWSIRRLIISSSMSNPLTTAPKITGRMFANSGDTFIEIVPGCTNNLGFGGESCKKGIIP